MRSGSSHAWLQRQIHDTFVKQAHDKNYRNRAAFKLVQLDDKHSFFRKNQTVVDLGCYSGGWSQVALERCIGNGSRVIGVDKLKIEPLPAPHQFIQGDITTDITKQKVFDVLDGKKANVVLSDMAPSTRGCSLDDHLAITDLNLKACDFMESVISPSGWFVMKTFQGPETKNLTTFLQSRFEIVRGSKPEASRKESSEIFIVCAKYKGRDRISSEVPSTFQNEVDGKLPGEKLRRQPQSDAGWAAQERLDGTRE